MGDGGPMCCFAAVSCGLVFLMIGLILAAVGPGQEVNLWYSCTLCKTLTPQIYISQSLTANEACKAFLPENKVESESFKVESEVFSGDTSRAYSPVIFRLVSQATIDFSVKTKSGDVLFDTKGKISLDPSKKALNSYNQRDLQEVEQIEEGEVVPARKLLKAGGGRSGSAGRSRSGSAGRWAGSTYYSRPYGYYGAGAVTGGTAVYVYRSGPYQTRGYYSTSEEHPSCSDTARGCEYETAYALDRDELSKYQFEFPDKDDDQIWPLDLTVKYLKAQAPPTTLTGAVESEPQVYITFFTDDRLGTEKAGLYFFVPVGVLLVVPGSCIAWWIGDQFL